MTIPLKALPRYVWAGRADSPRALQAINTPMSTHHDQVDLTPAC
jgi:hypothetical protein